MAGLVFAYSIIFTCVPTARIKRKYNANDQNTHSPTYVLLSHFRGFKRQINWNNNIFKIAQRDESGGRIPRGNNIGGGAG